jgi:glycosyltransferase involved in cell wall biosynthesis
MIINVFTIGDAKNINTWSNVPYFVTKALESEAIQVVNININPNKYLSKIYKYSVALVLKCIFSIFKVKYEFNYFRSGINNHLTHLKIKKHLKSNRIGNCNLFLTYSFSSWLYSDVPVIHLCDQMYEEVLLKRRLIPGYFEKRIINRELKVLRNASFVFSTNVNTFNLLNEKYKLSNCSEIKYRINLDITGIEIDRGKILEIKKETKYILFVGKAYYERGVDILLEAFEIFNSKSNNQFELHIVGPVAKEIRVGLSSRVVLHNYLDKGIESEFNTYIDLLKKSIMFVFPMRFGPFPIAAFEAAFYYTPSIITKIDSIEKDIKDYENGLLINKLDPIAFANAMIELSLNNELREQMAINAHNYAKEFTLKAMAQTIISRVNKFQSTN